MALRRSSDELATIDRAHLIHPYLPLGTTDRVVMVAGEGSRLWDADGREYLDATGGLWLAQVGHGRRELAEAAAAQMEKLEFFSSFWEFTNDKAVELARRLVELAPASLDHVYYTSGGTEGNEAALRMARTYHLRRGEPERTWILARNSAFHGVGFGSGTMSGFDMYHEVGRLPDVHHLTPPWAYRQELFNGQDATDFCIRELEKAIERIGPHRIAALFGEPVMGVGGMLVPPGDYWPRVEAVLRRHGILLVLDEVVTAYGRVGKWFGAERFGVDPDIIVTAKGITSGYVQLGAVLVRDTVAEVLQRDTGFMMGYTYNGHPVACAVALANLEIVEREGLLDRAVKIGAVLKQQLERLYELPIVGEVRGCGMMLAVELVADPETRETLPAPDFAIADAIRRESGVIVRGLGHNIVMSPPLVLSEAEAATIADAMYSVLERTGTDGRVREP